MADGALDIYTWNGESVAGRHVVVAMSGGVDSTCAALLLKKQGARVSGVTLLLFDSHKSRQAVIDAGTACRILDIPHQVLDIRTEFRERVIHPFIRSYRRGTTPNPCLECNPLIKWTLLLERATGNDPDALLATGHYARVGTGPEGFPALFRGAGKDQSYFLSRLTRRNIERTVFPVGHIRKTNVRKYAAHAGLPASHRPDSQEICFVDGNRYIDFLESVFREDIPPPGDIVFIDGTRLGRHRGIHRYTIGQRQGLGIAYSHSLYVIKIDAAANRIIVGPKDAALTRIFLSQHTVWSGTDPPSTPITVDIQVRYRHTAIPCIVSPLTPDARTCRVELTGSPAVVAPGQGAAFYLGDLLLGGGVITELPDAG